MMKRLFMVVVAMLSMTMTYAEDEKANNVENVSSYDMSVNMRRLGESLGLNFDQMESVAEVHKTFCGEMMIAAQANSADDRDKMVRKAVKKNLKYMHYILTEAQYDWYELLLNTTLHNRGIEVKEK